MDTYAYIYKITNIIDNKPYIGFTSASIEKRWKQHIKDSETSKCVLYRAMRKYGIENFKIEVVAMSPDAEYCKNVLEPYYIKKYNSNCSRTTGCGYNMTDGGDGTLGHKHSKKTKEKMKANVFSKEHKEKLKIAATGRILSEKTKEKLKIAGSGKTLSEETKEKLRIAHIGKTISEEHKEKLITIHAKKYKFLFNNQIIEIINLSKYCRENNLNRSCMGAVYQRRLKSHKGYTAPILVS